MAFCIKCGAPHGPTSQFCQGCGSALAQPNAGTSPAVAPAPYASAAANPPAPMPIKKKKGKALKIIGIVVAVFFALIVWGAISDAGKNGGKRPAESSGSSESSSAAAPASANMEEQEKDGGLMCSEIQAQLKDFLKDTLHGIECKPGAEAGGIALIVAYPAPLLANDGIVRKNLLLTTFSLAGAAISRHPNTTVKEVYALDSTTTSFAVPGDFAQQLYAKLVNNQWSQQEGLEEIAKVAHRVKIPQKGH